MPVFILSLHPGLKAFTKSSSPTLLPTPDEAISACTSLMDTFLGCFPYPMPPASTTAAVHSKCYHI